MHDVMYLIILGLISHRAVMALNIVHYIDWRACFDFLSEPFSFVLLCDDFTQEISLVMKNSADELFIRQIMFSPQVYRLEYELVTFSNIESLLDYYHENYLYERSFGTVRHFKLKRAVYNSVLSLKHLATVAVRRNRIPNPYEHIPGMMFLGSKYF